MLDETTSPSLDIQPEAGPSRPSPLLPVRSRSHSPNNDNTDVRYDSASRLPVEEAVPSEQGAELLLKISTLVEQQPVFMSGPSMLENLAENEGLTSPTAPSEARYPYTPPDDSQQPSLQPPTTVASASMSHLLAPSSLDKHPALDHYTLDSAVKSKTKRKRNAQAGPSSRPLSNGLHSIDRDRPPHWMGEDNTVIRCICGVVEDDGFTIQCEGCGAWEHGQCFGYLDESSAPDTYFCELCVPREVDAVGARWRQTSGRASRDPKLAVSAIEEEITPEKEKAKPRTKAKRGRTGSLIDGDVEPRDTIGDPSPSIMGPPAPSAKPKRRSAASKARPKSSTGDSTPAQASKGTLPLLDLEDGYFGLEPWALEFTPVPENIVRGKLARQIMGSIYREWADAEDELMSEFKRPVSDPSGLPSPTETGVLHLSPEAIFFAPDFGILAPPIPPVFLTSVNLNSIAAPVSVHPINDTQSFLPLNYAEISSYGVYSRPALYGVFAEDFIAVGAFIGEYRGEILDCETYRRDPINQYSVLGLPKPYVRSVGPPINLMIDARGYGCDLRFVRSGCHPNAVIRPVFWRQPEGELTKLKFGVFANKEIASKDEVVLAWEWDDQHVVHSLKRAIIPTIQADRSLGFPAFSVDEAAITMIAYKFDTVLTHLFGTFSACACQDLGSCAIAQMRHIVEVRQSGLQSGRRAGRADLEPLIGAVRGWRRREIETDAARRWMMPDAFDLRFSSSQSPVRSDFTKGEPEPVMHINTAEAVEVDVEHLSNADSPDGMRHSSPDAISEEAVVASRNVPRSASLGGKLLSSSSLSSAASAIPCKPAELDVDMNGDDGQESDATTATVVRSHDSESEGEEDAHGDVEVAAQGLSIAKRESLGKLPGSVTNDTHRLDKMLDDPYEQNKRLADPEALKEMMSAEVETLKTESLPMEQCQYISTGPRRSRKKRIVSSPISVDEEMDIDMDDATRQRPDSRNGFFPPPEFNKLEEICLDTPDQIVSNLPDCQEIHGSPGGVAAKKDVMTDSALGEKEMSPPRDAMPLPREPTPPPPEPPKKVSLSEYLKNHKIRKESLAIPSTLLGSPSDETSFDEISGLSPSASTALLKVEPETTSTRVNLLEHLPSSRASNTTQPSLNSMTSPLESVKPTVTPSAAYNPRVEYFPNQSAPVFAPRVSSSYTPRQNSSSSSSLPDPGAQFTIPNPRPVLSETLSSYASRSTEEPTPPFLPYQIDDRPLTPPKARFPMPSAVPARDTPPHQGPQTPTTTTHRAPPTGPKMPPTGPRASWNPPVSPAVASSIRGGFSPVPTRGFGGVRGGFSTERGGSSGFGADRGGFGGERAGFGGERGGFFRGRGLFRGRGGRGG